MATAEADTSEKLNVLQTKGDNFSRLAVIETKRRIDLEDAIKHITEVTEKYRADSKKYAIAVMNKHIQTPNPAFQRADGVNVGKEAEQVTKKVVKTLEVQLNRLNNRRSEVEIKNGKLKTEIDHYRRLRIQTDNAHARYSAELAETKKEIEALLGGAKAIIDERDKNVEQKDILERRNNEEQNEFEGVYEEFGTFIKEQNAALEVALLNDRKEEKTLKKTQEPEHLAGSLTAEEEDAMAGRVGELQSHLTGEQDSLANVRKKIVDYEIMFDQLKSMTRPEEHKRGTATLADVISAYTAHEDEMFSLYNYCQAVNAEIETFNEAIQKIQVEIAKYKEEQDSHSKQQQQVHGEMQRKVEQATESVAGSKKKFMGSQDSVEQISKKVQSLFFKLQCDQMDTKAKQGSKSSGRPESRVALLVGHGTGGVTESNVLDFMGVIEQRAVDIISDYLRFRAQSEKGICRSPTPGPGTSAFTYDLPRPDYSTVDDDEELLDAEETDGKLVDLSSFKEKLKKKIQGGALIHANGLRK
jgi:chromosome segregation ATPase